MAGSREVAGGFGWGDPGGAGVRGVDRQDFDGAGAEKFPLQSPGGHGIIICMGSARCALWGIRRTACRCDGMVDVTDSKSVGGDTVWVRVPPPAPAPPRATLPGAGFVFMMGKPARALLGRGRALLGSGALCGGEELLVQKHDRDAGLPRVPIMLLFLSLSCPPAPNCDPAGVPRAGLSRQKAAAIRFPARSSVRALGHQGQ